MTIEPGSAEQLEYVRALIARWSAAKTWGIQLIHLASGNSRIAMRMGDCMLNGMGTAHGGAIFALGDTAFAFAANGPGKAVVSHTASINFLSAAHPQELLTAQAVLRARSGRSETYAVAISGEDGRPVAEMQILGRTIGKSHRKVLPENELSP